MKYITVYFILSLILGVNGIILPGRDLSVEPELWCELQAEAQSKPYPGWPTRGSRPSLIPATELPDAIKYLSDNKDRRKSWPHHQVLLEPSYLKNVDSQPKLRSLFAVCVESDASRPYLRTIQRDLAEAFEDRTGIKIPLFFILGKPHRRRTLKVNATHETVNPALNPHDSPLIELIQREAEEHDDIIMGDFMDNYSRLSHKTLFLIRYVASRLPDVQIVIKMDTDVLPNYELIVGNFTRLALAEWPINQLYLGWFNYGQPVIRHPKSPYFAPEDFISESVWPAYASGPFYALSKDVVNLLSDFPDPSQDSDFAIEDVHTGILTLVSGIPRTKLRPVKPCGWDAQRTTSENKCECELAIHMFTGGLDAFSRMAQWNAANCRTVKQLVQVEDFINPNRIKEVV